MKKAILTIVICTCLTSSCISIPREIRKAFTYCYTDTYTGIDTLINIDGYYSANNPIIFYDNGLVVHPISSRFIEQFKNKDTLFLKEIAENLETKESKSFYDFVDCGSYVICGDTIKVQMIHKYYSLNDYWSGMERWYKIIDGNIHLLDRFLITTNQKEKEVYRRNYPVPIPAGGGAKIPFVPVPVKPPLDYYWILKEKWFWCNEQDWKDYMEKIKQKKKK